MNENSGRLCTCKVGVFHGIHVMYLHSVYTCISLFFLFQYEDCIVGAMNKLLVLSNSAQGKASMNTVATIIVYIVRLP